MDINNFDFKFITSIELVNSNEWNSVIDTEYPFMQYEFLHALEASGCVRSGTGWQPQHLLVYLNDSLVALMPLYIKTHSYGEYVFDFQWANAFYQSGLVYYPKLLSAIPFTPCAGKRLCITEKYRELLEPVIVERVIRQAKKLKLSSWHWLFPNDQISTLERQAGLMQRSGMQYHWYNKGYQSFDEFLASCKIKARKNIKRERRCVNDAGIKLRIIEGPNISKSLWEVFYYFYQRTYAKRSGNGGYLNQSFFEEIGLNMTSQLMMVVAELDDEVIGASLFLKGNDVLYGRYWGANAEYEFLHFEACYYQGIKYCIEQGINHFDAGAQGEHKIQRGFEPIETYSYHWIGDELFRPAIQDFVDKESLYVRATIKELGKKLPFK